MLDPLRGLRMGRMMRPIGAALVALVDGILAYYAELRIVALTGSRLVEVSVGTFLAGASALAYYGVVPETKPPTSLREWRSLRLLAVVLGAQILVAGREVVTNLRHEPTFADAKLTAIETQFARSQDVLCASAALTMGASIVIAVVLWQRSRLCRRPAT